MINPWIALTLLCLTACPAFAETFVKIVDIDGKTFAVNPRYVVKVEKGRYPATFDKRGNVSGWKSTVILYINNGGTTGQVHTQVPLDEMIKRLNK